MSFKTQITEEMREEIDKLDQAESEFWERQGFPEYNQLRKHASPHLAHQLWAECVEREGKAYDSPMARRMFILGYLSHREIV